MRKLIDGIPETVPSGFRSFIYQTFLRKSAYNHELQQQIPPLWGLCQRTPYQVRFVLCSADQELLLHVEEIREDIPTKSAIYKKQKKKQRNSFRTWIWGRTYLGFDLIFPIQFQLRLVGTKSRRSATVRVRRSRPAPSPSRRPCASAALASA